MLAPPGTVDCGKAGHDPACTETLTCMCASVVVRHAAGLQEKLVHGLLG